MKNLLYLVQLFVLFTVQNTYAQMSITGAGYPIGSEFDCSGDVSFTDDGGAGANYSSNFNDTITLCPQLECTASLPGIIGGSKMTVVILDDAAAGLVWDVDASDTLYIYDGPNTSSPLLGAINSDNSPTGQQFTASESNLSGCLTLVFISDAAVEGAGWEAMFNCGFQPQTFEPHIEAYINGLGPDALSPADTGFVDICFGDSILFVAKPNFPNSCETLGFGYEQNVDNVSYQWDITDGGTYPDNDSIWFTPPARYGYLIDLKITDIFPQGIRTQCKVRVSQLPSFAGTGPEQDTICLGESTNLIGGVTATDTVGIDIPEGFFNLGGAYAGLTYLPDGSGDQYAAPIEISGFPEGSVISNSQDLNQVCITMEHSYTGDLEIALECPNGTQVTLLNSYSPGFIPGGSSGGSLFLGDPIDDFSGGGPGEGWEYCWSSVYNDWGDWPTELAAGNFVPAPVFGGGGNSLNPNGVFLPEEDFASFAGCPVNGTWTVIVQDNIGTDDGYIFEWGLFFDPSYFPGLEGYQNYVVNEYWDTDPTIISSMDDTLITVMPPAIGDYTYTYNITDDFGCVYDTTVTLTVNGLPAIFNDTTACDLTFQVSGLESNGNGYWFSDDTEISFVSSTDLNPTINSTSAGLYSVNFVDDACEDTVTTTINYLDVPDIFEDTILCDIAFQVPLDSIDSESGGYWTVVSGPGSGAFSPSEGVLNPLFTAGANGLYTLMFTDSICGNTDEATVYLSVAPTLSAPPFSCNFEENDLVFDYGSFDANDGVWSVIENPSTPFLEDTTVSIGVVGGEPVVVVEEINQSYTIVFTPNVSSCPTVQTTLNFPPLLWTEINDTTLCYGVVYPLDAWESPYDANYSWDTGANGNSIDVTEEGIYYVTISNECYAYTDSAIIDFYLCDIEAPNVVVLSSQEGNNLFFVNSDGIAEFECIILNRWGNVVYEYSDINSGWDGRDKSGSLLEEGVYFYRIKAKAIGGNEIEKHGNITLFH